MLRDLIHKIDGLDADKTDVEQAQSIDSAHFAQKIVFHRVNNVYAGGADTWAIGIISAPRCPILVRSLSTALQAGVCDNVGYGISNGLIMGQPNTWDEIRLSDAALAIGLTQQIIRPSDAVIVPQGYSLYVVTYENGSAARTTISWVTYIEVDT